MTVGANDLTTLASVKEYLRIAKDNDDGLLQSLITGISAAIQQYLNRVILSSDYVMVKNGAGYGQMVMPFDNWPCTAVTSVNLGGTVITQITINNFSNRGYRFDTQNLYLSGYVFPRGWANVIIDYTAGYETVPASIQQAANQWIGYEYREIDHIGHSSKVLAGENVQFITDAMPKDVELMLSTWKKVVPTGGGLAI